MSGGLAEAEEAAAFAETLRAAMATAPRVWERSPEETRRAGRAGEGPFGAPVYSPRGVWRTIAGRSGPIRLRLIGPRSGEPDRIYYRIHGGGWVLGAADAGELALEALADGARALVVSVAYRLAPEHPFPAAVEDCVDAAIWLRENAASAFGIDRLTIGGDSAGAHLTVLTLLALRARFGDTGFSAANLLYGLYDLGGTPSLLNWGEDNLILDTPTTLWFRDQFLGANVSYRAPEVSPLYADLTGLPPALFTVGTLDPLIDDSLLMHERWGAFGNPAELRIYPGGVHAFDAFGLAMSRRAQAVCGAFLAAA